MAVVIGCISPRDESWLEWSLTKHSRLLKGASFQVCLLLDIDTKEGQIDHPRRAEA